MSYHLTVKQSARLFVLLAIGSAVAVAAEKSGEENSSVSFTDLHDGVTSFGAAIIGDDLYIYGGHHGEAHDYSAELQSDKFRRLRLEPGRRWEDLPSGPKLQGLALVGHGDQLYRIGGFTTHNQKGEKEDLWSSADVDRFDPATGKWTKFAPLPEPRSSHDAVVVGDKIYVAGGWKLQGKDQKRQWHQSAYVLNLTESEPNWQALPKPPFQRRALSVGSVDGKIYVIGGIQPNGKVSMEVDVFDAASGAWSKGPDLPGEGVDGFGTSAFAAHGKLYVSNVAGKVFRLDAAGNRWVEAGQLKEKRLFHRMVTTADERLLVVGGAVWMEGKAETVYTVPVADKP